MKKKAAPVSQRLIVTLVAGASVVLALGGCVPLVVGGAAVGAGMVATDRRSSGAQLDDTNIEVRGAARISEIANDNMNVTVISYNRQVLLTGSVATDADRRRAEEVITQIDNVRKVYNEIVVGPGTSIMDRSNDTYITSKVKAQLVSQSDIFANNFKVVTERSVVYLMGIATRAETDRASDIARSVDGVQKVVRIVEVVSASELGTTAGGTGASTTGGTSSSSVPLPPMAPLPPANAPASGGAVTTPVR